MAATRSCSISRPLRIAEALAARSDLADRPDLNAYRLLHGEADGVPGIAVDRYAGLLVIHADSPDDLDRWLPDLEEHLGDDYASAYAKIHPRGSSSLSTSDLEALAPNEPVWGPALEGLEAVEHGVRYLIQPESGLSVGLFLDMREVRAWLRAQAAGRSVLNLFAYTCSLGLVAALGGAQRVVNLDVSRPYLDWGKLNYELNDLPYDEQDFIYGDAFDWLARFGRRGTTFDVVIVDPPSFSSTPFIVTRDYPRLVAGAARVVSPAGILLAATNHARTSDQQFDVWLRSGLAQAGRRGRMLRSWHEPAVDFPVPTGRWPYLKVRALALD
jgi:23S rRNA (cytosine1962-C5)-methyltransferase